MTKQIRIEDADMSTHKVVIQIWEKQTDGPDIMVEEQVMHGPTDLRNFAIWKERYLVVKEA